MSHDQAKNGATTPPGLSSSAVETEPPGTSSGAIRTSKARRQTNASPATICALAGARRARAAPASAWLRAVARAASARAPAVPPRSRRAARFRIERHRRDQRQSVDGFLTARGLELTRLNRAVRLDHHHGAAQHAIRAWILDLDHQRARSRTVGHHANASRATLNARREVFSRAAAGRRPKLEPRRLGFVRLLRPRHRRAEKTRARKRANSSASL